MINNKRLKLAEILLIILVWFLLIAAPGFFRNENFEKWQDIIAPIEILIPLIIIFCLNRVLFVPKLLLKKRKIDYLVSVVLLISFLTVGIYMYSSKMRNRPPHEVNIQDHRLFPPPGRLDERRPPGPKDMARNKPIPPYANFLIFSVLLVGFDTGLRVSFRLAETEKEKAKLETENIGTQLAFLRNQVSPHFFMNTLNNIHSLIDINTDEAKEAVIQLSKLMRHLLYDSEIETIPVHKEIDFVKNYVDLMKLRFSDKVEISIDLPETIPDRSIPPLLFTSYLENAFKHGISYRKKSFIGIEFIFSADSLTFNIKNSNFQIINEGAHSGIGIENSKKRLDLIYGDNYSLKISEKKDEFNLQLTIPL